MLVPLLVLSTSLAVGVQTPAAPAAPTDGLAQAYFLFLQGREAESTGDVAGAISAFRKALEILPGAADVHAELAGLYARQGQATESLAEGQAALAIDKNNREAHRILGFVRSALAARSPRPADAQSLVTQAISHFEQALATGVRDPGAELSLGRLYVESGNYAKGIPRLQLFLLDRPGYPEAMLLLARAFDRSGKPAEAVPLLEGFVEAQPQQAPARVLLAQTYERLSRWKDAAAAWADLARTNPLNSTYRLRQATALAEAGDLDGARQQTLGLTRQTPRDVSAWYLLAQLERRAGNAAAAEEAARKIAEVDPADARGPLALAAAIEQAGDRPRAARTLEAARQRAPDDDSIAFALAGVYERDKRFDAAEQMFRTMLARDPVQAPVLNYLGYMLADRGQKLPEALDLVKRALALDTDNPSYLDSLGWVHVKLAQYDQARDPLERAATALPRVSVIQDHLAQLYFQLKRYRDAAAAWDRAIGGDREGVDIADITKKRDRARELAGR